MTVEDMLTANIIHRTDAITSRLRRAADDLDRQVRRDIGDIGKPGTRNYGYVASNVANTVRAMLGNISVDAVVEAAADADEARTRRITEADIATQTSGSEADGWRDVAADLFAEFTDEPVRIGTYVNQPPHTNGDPVMVHKARLDPETYAKIAHKLG